MKVIIAGSRGIEDWRVVVDAIKESGFEVTEVVSGGARGVDRIGESYAMSNNLPIARFRPDWKEYGKSAGVRRNEEMACYAEALIAVWDGMSRGTEDMISRARRVGLKVFIKIIEKGDR